MFSSTTTNELISLWMKLKKGRRFGWDVAIFSNEITNRNVREAFFFFVWTRWYGGKEKRFPGGIFVNHNLFFDVLHQVVKTSNWHAQIVKTFGFAIPRTRTRRNVRARTKSVFKKNGISYISAYNAVFYCTKCTSVRLVPWPSLPEYKTRPTI